jgi:acetyl-CoA carboxylase biotin carboxyl carrier protein
MFVEVETTKGDVLCVIEAMKLFNEIESEVSGKIVKY